MLFCITANYTPKALEAMGKNPNTNRREAAEKLVTAAGGKLVAMYGTVAEGPGAMVIFEADPAVAPAISGVAASIRCRYKRQSAVSAFRGRSACRPAKKNRAPEVLQAAWSISYYRPTMQQEAASVGGLSYFVGLLCSVPAVVADFQRECVTSSGSQQRSSLLGPFSWRGEV